MYMGFYLFIANCSGSPLPEDIVIINSTSSQLTYICNCSTSLMMEKTAVCVGNGTWLLPQVSCEDDSTVETDHGGAYYFYLHAIEDRCGNCSLDSILGSSNTH